MGRIRYFFPAYELPARDRFSIWRGMADGKLTTQARLGLEWTIFYYSLGERNTQVTATHFGISRQTMHKWLSRWNDRDLACVEEES